MSARRAVLWVVLVLVAGGAIAGAAIFIPKWYIVPPTATAAPEPPAQPAARKIRARLFYVAEDGEHLAGSDREVTFGEGPLEQARHLVEAELAEAPKPFISPVPAGTRLRAIYLSAGGEAYVDLSREAASGHVGGALSELLTVFAVVNVLTANLPAITSVQILVDGREVDTLAGHVDLRRPLAPAPKWLMEPPAAATPATQATPETQQKSPSWP